MLRLIAFVLIDEVVAQFKFTVLLMPNGPQKITGLPFDATLFESEHSIVDEEIKKLLSSSTRPKKPAKKKKAEGAKVSPILKNDCIARSKALECTAGRTRDRRRVTIDRPVNVSSMAVPMNRGSLIPISRTDPDSRALVRPTLLNRVHCRGGACEAGGA